MALALTTRLPQQIDGKLMCSRELDREGAPVRRHQIRLLPGRRIAADG